MKRKKSDWPRSFRLTRKSDAGGRSVGGIWRNFEDSRDEQQAQEALAALKRLPIDRQKPEPFEKVIRFLEEHFDWMTTFLRCPGGEAQLAG